METMYASKDFVNQSIKILSQILGLRLFYPSKKFDHEIDLKGLMYLVFLD